jgi:transcriptional regulator with XRE-family HTH domain
MLGARIRHARRVARLTMTQLAVRAGCSESLISKIENALATPSLAMLHRIAVALDSNIASLTAEEAPAASPVLRKGARPVLRTGGIALERLVMAERGGLLQANIHIVEPGAASDGQIVHVGEEVGYVLAGRIELTLGDTRYVLQAGDAFTFPASSRMATATWAARSRRFSGSTRRRPSDALVRAQRAVAARFSAAGRPAPPARRVPSARHRPRARAPRAPAALPARRVRPAGVPDR